MKLSNLVKPDRCLFIDPGMSQRSFAWALMDNYSTKLYETGIIELREKNPDHRLSEIYDGLCEIRNNYYIDKIFVEDTVFYFSSTSCAAAGGGAIMRVANAVGVVLLFGQFYEIPATRVDPRKWRGNLSDKLVADRVFDTIGFCGSQHITDAIGMGLSLMGKL